jgi:hypothetical protein
MVCCDGIGMTASDSAKQSATINLANLLCPNRMMNQLHQKKVGSRQANCFAARKVQRKNTKPAAISGSGFDVLNS